MCFDYTTTHVFKGCGHSCPVLYDYFYCPNTEMTGIPCHPRIEVDDELRHEFDGLCEECHKIVSGESKGRQLSLTLNLKPKPDQK